MTKPVEKFCYFCKETLGDMAPSMLQLRCYRHDDIIDGVGHWYESPYEVFFKVKIKGSLYKVVIYPAIPRTEVIIKRKTSYETDLNKVLIKVPEVLNITPENARKKLPLIVVFS